jgi:NRAMP (natural resistance-associated macrophage protein)-like metal ion transporter
LVTSAFIGPGTVLTASRAGADFGFSLLWAVFFSLAATIVLQEMASRLGVIRSQGLAETIARHFQSAFVRICAVVLVLGAILFGNSAFQTGNLIGAAAGIEILFGLPMHYGAVLTASIAMVVIWIGRYELLQWLLTVLVALMGLIFVISAVLSRPALFELIRSLVPSFPAGSVWTIIGLIGTTVVPYNLFLHASASARQFGQAEDKNRALRISLVDTILSISVGGIITAALLVTAAVAFEDSRVELSKVSDIAQQLRPSLGIWAERSFAVGLFAAGLTSAITAPLAAGVATAGCFGWDIKSISSRLIASGVILVGLFFSIQFGASPIQTIVAAQVANGILLPLVAAFLLYVLNLDDVMGRYKNGWVNNVLGALVVMVTIAMAIRQLILLLESG